MEPTYNEVIYWVRARSPRGVERVPCYFKGQRTSENINGRRGDVKVRPVSIGQGPFTATHAPEDFEHEDGSPVFFPIR